MKHKILFIGNSITYHEPAPNIGWYGTWGMAATSEDKDYVHEMLRLLKGVGMETEPLIQNVADFEKGFWDYDLEKMKPLREFGADIIILRIAENISEEEAANRNFLGCFDDLIQYLNPGNKALVVCSTGFGEHPHVNRQIEAVAAKRGYPLVDLSALFYNVENQAQNDFEHEGVAAHPSDFGMKTIANLLFSAVMCERHHRQKNGPDYRGVLVLNEK